MRVKLSWIHGLLHLIHWKKFLALFHFPLLPHCLFLLLEFQLLLGFLVCLVLSTALNMFLTLCFNLCSIQFINSLLIHVYLVENSIAFLMAVDILYIFLNPRMYIDVFKPDLILFQNPHLSFDLLKYCKQSHLKVYIWWLLCIRSPRGPLKTSLKNRICCLG